jgi:hypothetical protein
MMGLICRYIPMAPDLDEDVDLTKQQLPANQSSPPGPAPRANNPLPAEARANGCA